MDRRSKIIIGLFVLVLLGIIVTEIARPKPINWRPSYTSFDTIPFGCYVLFQELQSLFPDSEIQPAQDSPYSILTERDSLQSANYIFINSTLNFDEQETNQILKFVDQGNSVFMAATYFGHFLSDTLKLEVKSDYAVQEDTVSLSHTNNTFNKKWFSYNRGLFKSRFTSVDSLNTTILGYLKFKENNFLTGQASTEIAPNFVQIKFGKGNFYLHSNPVAFTNYYLLTQNQEYISHTLSYLDNSTILWDGYEKSGRVVVDSPMRFVLNQASLRWAYYLTITGLLIFVIFRAKREQRIILVIEPLENSSIEFARTVGGLYFQHKDYTDLISKKINFFLEYIRSRYYLDITVLSDKTARDLAAKSGKTLTETKNLTEQIAALKNKTVHTEQDLIALNKKITAFKQ